MPKKGYKWSEVSKRKLSMSRKGKYTGESNPFYGKCHTEETKRKISESQKRVGSKPPSRLGVPHSDKARMKISKRMKGKNHPNWGGMYSKSGKEHPNWEGGISNFPYDFNFNKELKALIRKRDKHTCQLCYKRKRANCDLSIHHIDYNKQDSNPENLITLCKSCNSKVNFNRKIWRNYFMSINLGIIA